jgi:RNA polymerase sigma factor (TIGR02999 family)
VGDITQILQAVEQGENSAERLLPLVYGELRRLAAHKMAHEAPAQTLQATALVHEAWLRLVGADNPKFEGRAHFFAAAAEAMRRILIDNARRKRALRHGGSLQRVDIQEVEVAARTDDEQLLAIHEALDKLAVEDKVAAELVKLRYFVGLTIPEAAEILGISETTASRNWTFARTWLYHEIKNQSQ